MPELSIRDAAKHAGVSKTSIFRAIQSGRMSAPRKDDGTYAIDPSELFRAFPPKSAEGQGDTSPPRPAGQTVPGAGAAGDSAGTLEVRLARAEEQLQAMRQVLEAQREVLELERKRAEELRQERDKWSAALEASQRQITHITTKAAEIEARRGWWPFKRAG